LDLIEDWTFSVAISHKKHPPLGLIGWSATRRFVLSTKNLGVARQNARASAAPSHRGEPRPAELYRRLSSFAAIPAPHHPAHVAGGTYGSHLRYTVTADSKNRGVVAQQGRRVEFGQIYPTHEVLGGELIAMQWSHLRDHLAHRMRVSRCSCLRGGVQREARQNNDSTRTSRREYRHVFGCLKYSFRWYRICPHLAPCHARAPQFYAAPAVPIDQPPRGRYRFLAASKLMRASRHNLRFP
jgi:hypothetical protein